jgi:hypothetical protein
VDGYVDSGDITDHLAGNYNNLYNSVPSDEQNMKRIREFIDMNCGHCIERDRVVSHMEVSEAIGHLKANESDGDVGLMSNHLLMSSDNFQKQLSLLITAILTHGYQPQTVLLATIASIPKDNRGNLCDSKNYRGITICTSISKPMDIILIIRYKEQLQTSDMQFAFKEKHSTVMCSLVVKEVIQYYLNNKSDVYSCCVDATKAFDRVQHDKLFDLLIARKAPAIALRALLDMYQRQSMSTM